MEPTIELYNQFVKEDSTLCQQEIMNRIAPGAMFSADYNKFFDLMKTLQRIDKYMLPKYLSIGQSHEEILYAIDDWNLQYPFKIWNIDHHHDCGYGPPEDSVDMMLAAPPGCGNWVQHLIKNNKFFKEYIWIKNSNSAELLEEDRKKRIPSFLSTTDISIIDNIKFDRVFICRSPGWMPEKYYPLVDSLIFAFEYFTGK